MPSSPDIQNIRQLETLTALLIFVLAMSGCAGALFKVKPVIDLPPMRDSAKSVSGGGLNLRAAVLMTDEESQDLFEANLPIAGLLPLRIELVHESGVPVELKKARFHLRDSEGREWKLLSPKAATARILKANDVYAYNPNSRKQFEKEFATYDIDLKTPLSDSNPRRQGFLFFQSPDKQPVTSPRGLILSVDRLPQPLEVQLN